MSTKNIVTLVVHSREWKDRAVGYARYRVTGECCQCNAPVQEVLNGTRDECARAVLLCTPCEDIAERNAAEVRRVYG